MTSRRAATLVGALLGLAVGACEVSLPVPNTADAARTKSSVRDLELGRGLYGSRCGSCHALRDPVSIAPKAWSAEVNDMRTKNGVHLSDDEAQRITDYLVSISSR